ncbi:hypothetical protein SALBM311S_09875 [Streptomyces alboniger]
MLARRSIGRSQVPRATLRRLKWYGNLAAWCHWDCSRAFAARTSCGRTGTTGARIEELLELTHLSMRQYQAATGEMAPLLPRYDGYKRAFGPLMPHPFQCPSQHRLPGRIPNGDSTQPVGPRPPSARAVTR